MQPTKQGDEKTVDGVGRRRKTGKVQHFDEETVGSLDVRDDRCCCWRDDGLFQAVALAEHLREGLLGLWEHLFLGRPR